MTNHFYLWQVNLLVKFYGNRSAVSVTILDIKSQNRWFDLDFRVTFCSPLPSCRRPTEGRGQIRMSVARWAGRSHHSCWQCSRSRPGTPPHASGSLQHTCWSTGFKKTGHIRSKRWLGQITIRHQAHKSIKLYHYLGGCKLRQRLW